MKGLLIYDSIGAKRNEWFINSLILNFKEYNIDLQLRLTSNGEVGETQNIDFAIVRTIAPQINKMLEEVGVRVFNNFATSFVANDKWQTYLLCQKLGIATMPTQYNLDDVDENTLPCVIKSCDGHGGAEVFWVDTLNEFLQVKSHFKGLGKNYIIQPPCSELGKDMRIYLMDGQIISSILRYNPNSFKSNYSLGGQVQEGELSDYQIEVVKKISSYLGSDYIGVDFIIDNGKWVLNEIEDVVGARMLYQVTGMDVAKRYVDYIVGQLKQNK